MSETMDSLKIIIGIGGTGSAIADMLAKKRQNDTADAEVFCIDIDSFELSAQKNILHTHKVSVNLKYPDYIEGIRRIVDKGNVYAECIKRVDKFNCEELLMSRQGCRAIFELGLQQGDFDAFLKTISDMAQEHKKTELYVINTLGGYFASAVFLQLGMLMRSYLAKHNPGADITISGSFILPTNFDFISTKAERAYVEANAYASLMELGAIDASLYHGGGAVPINYSLEQYGGTADIPPYDCCYIHELKKHDGKLNIVKVFACEIEQEIFGKAPLAVPYYKGSLNLITCKALVDPESTFRQSYEDLMLPRGYFDVTPHLDARFPMLWIRETQRKKLNTFKKI